LRSIELSHKVSHFWRLERHLLFWVWEDKLVDQVLWVWELRALGPKLAVPGLRTRWELVGPKKPERYEEEISVSEHLPVLLAFWSVRHADIGTGL